VVQGSAQPVARDQKEKEEKLKTDCRKIERIKSGDRVIRE
jgi:hypothetical protein